MPRIARIRTNRKTGRRSVVVTLGALPKLPPRIRRPKYTYRQSIYALGGIEREAFTFIDRRASDDLFASTSVAQLAEALRINRTRAHRLILRLSDRGLLRPTDRFRQRWLPTLKAYLALHMGAIEGAVLCAAEGVETNNSAMQTHAVQLLADILRSMPARFKNDAGLGSPIDNGLLASPNSKYFQRPGVASTVRQCLHDPPDAEPPTSGLAEPI